MNPINKIAFVINNNKPGAEALAQSLMAKAENQGVATIATNAYPLPDNLLCDAQCCVVIGGDGTLLSVVGEAVNRNLPVIGINLGKLGFMATFSADEAEEEFESLITGSYQIVERSVIVCTNADNKSARALNDVVVKSNSSRLVRLEVFSNEEPVNDYYCDGLVFSTPTGSTAYNMSAGGPIIHPSAKVIAMTPICPHTLSNRSVIFDQEVCLKVYLHDRDHDVTVSIDGRSNFNRTEDFPLKISLSKNSFPLMLHEDYSHFKLMRSKLNWAGDFSG